MLDSPDPTHTQSSSSSQVADINLSSDVGAPLGEEYGTDTWMVSLSSPLVSVPNVVGPMTIRL